jgi:hypothetical protein
MLEVRQAAYAGNYAVHLVFSNGRRPVFAQLRERSSFSSFKVAHSALVWNDGLGIAPEYLYYLAFKDEQDLQEQFRQWGYIS